jgi:hypothetical protein
LASDLPGYSTHVLPKGARVPKADDDYETNHKIDENDGVDAGAVPLRQGFAQGAAVGYWDFGVTKGNLAPAYFLTLCDSHGEPAPNGALDHPWFWDSAPGDPDYSPFRSFQPVCVTTRYAGELITSAEALSDAIDMQLVIEPGKPVYWLDLPVVAKGVKATGGLAACEAYVGGHAVHCVSLADEEGRFAYKDKRIAAENVYELSFAGSEDIERVVFAQALLDARGQRNPLYAPAWKVVAVTLASDADPSAFDSEDDLVKIAADGSLTPIGPLVLEAKATGDTVNRPQRAHAAEVAP